MKNIIIIAFFLLFIQLPLLSGCIKNKEAEGYLLKEEDLSTITPGVTTKSEVLQKLGSPSTKSDFGNETWLYISKKIESVAFFSPETKEQKVMSIEFNNDIVANVNHFNLSDAHNIKISSDKTPTEGNSIGFLEQAVGNIGKFNKGQSARTPSSRLPDGY